eukprot:m.165308 g.165308  ORF g.165308 m.165308 type:complete len:169 (-) comp15257_c0_seq8:2363-2869(-)
MAPTIGEGTLVCKTAEIEGDVSIGKDCIIHPTANIIAKDGPIVIGDSCIIEEQVKIINEGRDATMTIGSFNVFEMGSQFYGPKVGDSNVLEAKSYAGPSVEIGDACRIGASLQLKATETLTSGVVVYGKDTRRVDQKALAAKGAASENLTLQLNALKKILPKFHSMKS